MKIIELFLKKMLIILLCFFSGEVLTELKMPGDAHVYQNHRKAAWATFTVGFFEFLSALESVFHLQRAFPFN